MSNESTMLILIFRNTLCKRIMIACKGITDTYEATLACLHNGHASMCRALKFLAGTHREHEEIGLI